MIDSTIIRRLAALKLPAAAMGEVLSIIADVQAQDEARVSAEEARKIRERERKRRGKSAENPRQVPGQSTDTSAEIPAAGSPKERSPTPSKENNPSSSLRSATKQKETTARASRIPEDFHPDLAEGIRLGLSPADAAIEAANFIDYWHQANGRTAVKRDWRAAWRVWCRKAVQDRASSHHYGNGKVGRVDLMLEALSDIKNEREAEPQLRLSGEGKR